ncbi:Bacterial Ig-like domain (group 4) [Pseudoscardovia radai]|uniref:Bacterial Ig-like domain (Group 4) n=1 Tax=Pseudoscardovia radai TaxID=987066 RepID=A0A261EVA3_9BIFI|nr:Ig-like domain-containing protein [Pseudoscardovia radai]OZG50789.1 Bacterial Ig-like domain (group 4) [Pseudoscardovia radai]
MADDAMMHDRAMRDMTVHADAVARHDGAVAHDGAAHDAEWGAMGPETAPYAPVGATRLGYPRAAAKRRTAAFCARRGIGVLCAAMMLVCAGLAVGTGISARADASGAAMSAPASDEAASDGALVDGAASDEAQAPSSGDSAAESRGMEIVETRTAAAAAGTDAVAASALAEGDTPEASGASSAAPSATPVSAALTRSTTAAGTAPTLPATVPVIWSNGDTTDEPVIWDVSSINEAQYHGAHGGSSTFVVYGQTYDLRAVCYVTVTGATPVGARLDAASVSVPVDGNPFEYLPATAIVTWSNGDTSAERITWNGGLPFSRSLTGIAGSFTADGTVLGFAVSASVRMTSRYVIVASNPTSVSTDAGVAPTLPVGGQVLWSDSGDWETDTVDWDAVDPRDYHGLLDRDTSFVMRGTGRESGRSFAVTVIVRQAVAVSASFDGAASGDGAGASGAGAGAIGAGAIGSGTGMVNAVDLTTVAGTAPELPATATISWSNGDRTVERVTWNSGSALADSTYAQPGTFTVSGAVAGLLVTASVTVVAS